MENFIGESSPDHKPDSKKGEGSLFLYPGGERNGLGKHQSLQKNKRQLIFKVFLFIPVFFFSENVVVNFRSPQLAWTKGFPGS